MSADFVMKEVDAKERDNYFNISGEENEVNCFQYAKLIAFLIVLFGTIPSRLG